MELPKHGWTRQEVFEGLERLASDDYDWSSGRIFGYVFDPGREIAGVAEEALLKFYPKSGLDFTVYPSALAMENDIISFARDHLGGDPNVSGSFTSGGTESIILAVKAARDYARKKKPHIRQPEIVLPITAHAAFHKAAHYLGLKVIQTNVDANLRADVAHFEQAITDNAILAVGSAPGYAYGVMDPIEEMAALAEKRGVLFHSDACMGGFLLPYFRKLGRNIPGFDFTVKGVTSVSMDLHKYAYAPKGASVVLYKNKDLRKCQIFACANWTGYTMINTTIQSTKSTGPLAAAWATLRFVGDEGYMEFARKKLTAMEKVVHFIRMHPDLRLVSEPDMTLLAFTSDRVNIFHIIDEMNLKGWYIQPILAYGGLKESIHLSMNVSNVDRIDGFLKDLEKSIEEAKKMPSGTLLEKAEGIFANLDDAGSAAEALERLMATVGMSDGKIPKRFAPINEVVNLLPPDRREALLVEFANTLFQ